MLEEYHKIKGTCEVCKSVTETDGTGKVGIMTLAKKSGSFISKKKTYFLCSNCNIVENRKKYWE